MSEIDVGDVCLEQCDGSPVHVVADTGLDAATWSDRNGYDLLDNYGNQRVGTTADDRVFDVVYCRSASSEPSKTYAFPESRLLRVETERADDGRPVADRVRRDVLVELAVAAANIEGGPAEVDVMQLARYAGYDADLVNEADELADVEQTVVADG